jgi:hypothetical protein
MGRRQRVDQSQLVYLFNLEKEIPADLLQQTCKPPLEGREIGKQ